MQFILRLSIFFHWSIDLFLWLVPYCFDYYSFLIQSAIRKCDVSSFVLLSQDCFGYSGSFVVPHKFQDCFFYFCKNSVGILVGISLNLQMALGNTDILTILILSIHEHRISFHLFVSSSIYFINVHIVFNVENFRLLG